MKLQTYIGDMEIHNLGHPAKIQKRFLSILRDEGVNVNPYPAPSSKISNQVDEETEED